MKKYLQDHTCRSTWVFTLIELLVITSHLCCNWMKGVLKRNRVMKGCSSPACRQVKLYSFTLIELLVVIAIMFMPIGADKNLLELSLGGYLLLFLVGILGSSALIIPGISGSMLLLILGYYNPLVTLATDYLLKGKEIGTSILVLGTTALGIAVGFIAISVIMKVLFKKCPRGTYFAIIGFIVGSIPTIFVSTAKEAGMTFSTLPESVWHWIFCVLLLIVGFFLSYALVIYSRKHNINE